MNRPAFVISLDFELFWGVGDSRTIGNYGANVLGEWEAIPRMLALFRQYGMRVTWATVGMIMCRDYEQWCDLRPSTPPCRRPGRMSPYRMDHLVREHEKLFFARPLVEHILQTPGQELGTHTYSHFYCCEPEARPEEFAKDLGAASDVAAELGVHFRSAVLPRNQIDERFLAVLPGAGIEVYRGNRNHWLYRDGDAVAGGIAGRALRYADACLPLVGVGTVHEEVRGKLANVPASLFLYPWTGRPAWLSRLRLHRVKQGMSAAARSGGMFHLWWHPHNFGVNVEQNLAMLDAILRHYRMLADLHGMQTRCMGDFGGAERVGAGDHRDTSAPDLAHIVKWGNT